MIKFFSFSTHSHKVTRRVVTSPVVQVAPKGAAAQVYFEMFGVMP